MADANPIHFRQVPAACVYPLEHPDRRVCDGHWRLWRMATQGGDLLHSSTSDPGWQSLRLGGYAQALQLSRAGVDFIFAKLTETVLPVTLLAASRSRYRMYVGAINSFESSDSSLNIEVSRGTQTLCIRTPRHAWLVYQPCAVGCTTSLELFDDSQQPTVLICGQSSQCIAWRALTQWLALRESHPLEHIPEHVRTRRKARPRARESTHEIRPRLVQNDHRRRQ